MTLKDMSASRHPLDWHAYSTLSDRLAAIAVRFADLGYTDLTAKADATRGSLFELWNATVAAEREGR